MSYLATAGALLIEVAFGLLVLLFVLRVLLQKVRANFHNPISQFVYRSSNPVLSPIRRVLPPVAGWDLPALLVAWLLECLKVTLLFALAARLPELAGVAVLGIAELIGFVLTLYLWLIIIAVILSFAGVSAGQHPVLPLLAQLVAPVLGPFRRLIPPLGGFDLSPLFAGLALVLAQILVVAPLRDFGTRLA